MKKLVRLLKQHLKISAKMRWLKSINRAAKKYYRLEYRARAQAKVVHALCDRYADLYEEDLRKNVGQCGLGKSS